MTYGPSEFMTAVAGTLQNGISHIERRDTQSHPVIRVTEDDGAWFELTLTAYDTPPERSLTEILSVHRHTPGTRPGSKKQVEVTPRETIDFSEHG